MKYVSCDVMKQFTDSLTTEANSIDAQMYFVAA